MIEIRGMLRVKIPANGLWLYNSALQLFRKEVFLGIGDGGEDWTEITETEKIELEQTFETEIPQEENEASKEDLYNALAKLGVE